jgi:hypothetical protein
MFRQKKMEIPHAKAHGMQQRLFSERSSHNKCLEWSVKWANATLQRTEN